MNMNGNNTGSMLKKALEERQNGSLPSNFSFHMMEKIRIEAAKTQNDYLLFNTSLDDDSGCIYL